MRTKKIYVNIESGSHSTLKDPAVQPQKNNMKIRDKETEFEDNPMLLDVDLLRQAEVQWVYGSLWVTLLFNKRSIRLTVHSHWTLYSH